MPEYVPDNYDRFEEHDAEQERMLRKRPVCDCCGEYIQASITGSSEKRSVIDAWME